MSFAVTQIKLKEDEAPNLMPAILSSNLGTVFGIRCGHLSIYGLAPGVKTLTELLSLFGHSFCKVVLLTNVLFKII